MSPMFHSNENILSSRNDLYSLVAIHPEATFFLYYEGLDNDELAIFNGDILVVDRSVTPSKKSIIIIPDEESFRVCRMSDLADESPPDLWGVVVYVIHKTA